MSITLSARSLLLRHHCAHCSTPGRDVHHFKDSRCPHATRERAVACAFATFAEVQAGRHLTWNEDRLCNRHFAERAHLRRAVVGAGDPLRPSPAPSSAAGASSHRTATGTCGTFSTGPDVSAALQVPPALPQPSGPVGPFEGLPVGTPSGGWVHFAGPPDRETTGLHGRPARQSL